MFGLTLRLNWKGGFREGKPRYPATMGEEEEQNKYGGKLGMKCELTAGKPGTVRRHWSIMVCSRGVKAASGPSATVVAAAASGASYFLTLGGIVQDFSCACLTTRISYHSSELDYQR
jgi:hypothetical protein